MNLIKQLRESADFEEEMLRKSQAVLLRKSASALEQANALLRGARFKICEQSVDECRRGSEDHRVNCGYCETVAKLDDFLVAQEDK